MFWKHGTKPNDSALLILDTLSNFFRWSPDQRAGDWYGPKVRQLWRHAVAEVQKRQHSSFCWCGTCRPYAALGVDIANLLAAQPDTGESALEIVDQMVRSTAVDIVVIDSVAARFHRAEMKARWVILICQARLMSQA